MFTRTRDWLRPLIQINLLLCLTIYGAFFDIHAFVYEMLKNACISISELSVKTRLIISFSRPFVLAFLIWVLWKMIRASNKTAILNSGKYYHDHFYISYWVCRWILGYSSCNLARMPIYMQFKLVLNDLFPVFIYNEGIQESGDTDTIIVTAPQAITNTVNLVIMDTYDIYDNQLPDSVVSLSTIRIERLPKTNVRYHSNALIMKTTEVVRNLPHNVVRINIFATTNPWNTYDLAKQVINTGGRDTIKEIFVFQQNPRNPKRFSEDKKRII